jgi:ribonuclease P protein component
VSKSDLRKAKLKAIFDEGTKFVCKSFVAFFLHSNEESLTPYIIASKKAGNAIKRNRSKRRIREIIRLNIEPSIPLGKIIFLARGETYKIDFSLFQRDCNNLIEYIKKRSSPKTLNNTQPQIESP